MASLRGLPGAATSDASGFYSATVPYGFKGMITPDKEGWTFEPRSRLIKAMKGNKTDVNFEATEIKYTISGNVGLPGVRLIGLPGEPLSDAQGNYTAEVPHGWDKKVTPHKDGHRFTPESRTYTRMLTNRTRNNYTPSVIKLEISGSTGMPGVTLTVKGMPDSRTGPGGDYKFVVQYGWTGTVTPEKEGCTFSPPDRSYEVIREDQLKQDYSTEVIQFVISGSVTTDGSVGTDGVEMKGLPETVVTDSSGYFSTPVDYGWNGTIAPSKEGFEFTPPSIAVPRVLDDRLNDDFDAKIKTFIISGSTGVQNVQMYGFPGDPITGPGGVYQVEVPWGWTGDVQPTRHGYTFTPESQEHVDVTRDKKTGTNFTHEIMSYEIAGTTDVGQVKLKFTGRTGVPRVITSDATGAYNTKVNFDWEGTVTPEKEGFTFSPPARPYTGGLDGDMLYEHFTAAVRRFTISGDIVSDRGDPVAGVTIFTALGSDVSAVTDENGHFDLEVDYNWKGLLSPVKEGYTWTPLSKKVDPVTMNLSGQGFSGKVKMLEISGTIIVENKPVEGVIMDAGLGDDEKVVSDANGRYAVKVPWGWTGEIRAEKEGWFFDDPVQYTNVTTNYRDEVPETPAEPRTTTTRTVPEDETTPLDITPRSVTEPREIELPTTTTEIAPDVNGLTRTAPPTVEPGTETSDPELAALRAQLDALQKQVAGAGTSTSASVALDGSMTRSAFLEGDLVEVLQNLASDYGEMIIWDTAVGGDVSVDLVDVTLEEALDIVLAVTGFSWKKTEHYYLVTSNTPTSLGFIEGSETRRVNLLWVDAQTAINLLSPAFQQYVQGQGRSSAPVGLAPTTGTGTSSYGTGFGLSAAALTRATAGRIVIVTAPRMIMERIVADLKKIDKKPVHVFLDARIVVMEKGNLLNMGIEWRWPTVQAGMFRNPPLDIASTTSDVLGGEWPWGMKIGYSASGAFTNALEMQINLMEENGEARVVANPQVMTQDGKLAEFNVMTEEYFMMTPQLGELGGFGGYSRAELEKIESGTRLSITPYIGDNNDINLEVAVELSDSIPQARGTDLPVVTRRTTQNTVAVRDGGTVALAGLTQNRESIRHKRTPGLSKIPILGGLFNNDYDDKSSREVAVFVTARLVPEEIGPLSGGNRPGPRRVSTSANERPVAEPAYTPTGNFQEDLRQSLLESRNNRRR